MRIDGRIVLLSALLGVALWVIDAVADLYYFYEGSFGDLLLFDIPPHELYIRSVIFLIVFGAGVLMAGLYERVTARTEKLERRTDELERKNERLDEFTSIVAHDLRNPLNVAYGRIELAKDTVSNEDLSIAADSIKRSLSLIDEMETVARKGDEVCETEAVELTRTAETCWRNVRTADATLVTDGGATVRADPPRFRQLLENIIRNAVEHGGDQAVTVRVGTLPDGFYIEDDGCGIPAADRAAVFEPGYSEKRDGTGLGLEIVKQVAGAHGWEVRLTEAPDGGARFEFTGVARTSE